MNIREIQSATIVDLLADETDNSIEKLNKINFKKTVDISAITKIIEDCVAFKTNESSSIDDEKPIDAKYIYEQIANAYDAVKKCPEHEKCFEEISEIANKLGENVFNIFNILSTVINPEVENLVESIKKRTATILEESGNEIVVQKDIKTDALSRMTWVTYFNILGGIENLINTYKASYGHDFNYTPADVDYAITHSDLKVELMNIHPKTRADMLTAVSAKAGNGEQRQAVGFLFDVLTDPFRFNELFKSTVIATIDNKTMSAGLQVTCRAVENLYPVLRLFRETTFDITDEMNDVLSANIERVETLFKILGFTIAVARYNYKDALMIDVNLINSDNEDKFHEAGGTDEDIVKYMRIFYKDPEHFTLPTVGLTVDEIVSAKANVDEQFRIEEQTKLKNTEMIQHSALIQATNEVMESYLLSTPAEKIPENEDRELFLKHAINKSKAAAAFIMTDGDNNLCCVLFNIIIDLFYHDTILGTAHEMFGEELIKQAKLNDNIDENITSQIDVTVASRIVSKFLVDHVLDIN